MRVNGAARMSNSLVIGCDGVDTLLGRARRADGSIGHAGGRKPRSGPWPCRQRIKAGSASAKHESPPCNLYSQNQADSKAATIILEAIGKNALEGWVEYLFRENILVVNYYRKEKSSASTKLENILIVYNTERKEKWFNEIILKGVQTPSPGSFFVRDGFVYFIKDQTTLTALQPWKS